MDAESERNVAVGVAPDVEDTRVIEDPWIAIGRCQHQPEDRARGNVHTANLGVGGGPAPVLLEGRLVAQHLGDRHRQEVGILPQQPELVRMLVKAEDSRPDHVGEQLITTGGKVDAGGQQLILADHLPVVVGSDQRGEDVVPWLPSQFFHHASDPLPKFQERSFAPANRVRLGCTGAEERDVLQS